MNERRQDFERLQRFTREGEQSAFADVVRRHLDLVFATALRKVEDPGAAQEVSQNVFAALGRKAWQFGRDDSLPAWLHKAALLSGSGDVRPGTVTSVSVEAQANLDNPSTVVFYTYDFPGWRATVDGSPVPHRTHPPYGLIALDLPAGEHTVAIHFGTTPARTPGTLISAFSLVVAVGLLVYSFRRRPTA